MPISRRRLLYLAAAIGGTAMTAGIASNFLQVKKQNIESEGNIVNNNVNNSIPFSEKPYSRNVYTQNGKSLVSIVLGTNLAEDIPGMVRTSIGILGGIEKIDVKGKNIIVKPNTNSNRPNPASTNPIVVGTVVKMLVEAGAANVKVGDCSNINNRTRDVMRDQGIQEAVEDAGGEVIFLDEMEYVTVKIPWGRQLTETRISKPVYESERLIDIPVIKSHNVTSFSMSMKNFIGVIHKESRLDPTWQPSKIVFHSSENPSEAVAELNLLVKPDLIVMDGTKSLVSYGEGDDSGEVRETNMIISSGDRIANDIVGLSIIKSYGLWPPIHDKSVWSQDQIKRALELELGRDKNNLKIVSKSLVGQEKLDQILKMIQSETEILEI